MVAVETSKQLVGYMHKLQQQQDAALVVVVVVVEQKRGETMSCVLLN